MLQYAVSKTEIENSTPGAKPTESVRVLNEVLIKQSIHIVVGAINTMYNVHVSIQLKW